MPPIPGNDQALILNGFSLKQAPGPAMKKPAQLALRGQNPFAWDRGGNKNLDQYPGG